MEALRKGSYIEYLLDILVYGTPEEKKALIAEQRTEVMKLEQRFAEPTTDCDHGRSLDLRDNGAVKNSIQNCLIEFLN